MTNKSLAGLATTAVSILAIALTILVTVLSAGAEEVVIHHFDKTHGSLPLSGLVSDAAGNLYGTTNSGGIANCGTIFELSPDATGKWTHTLLYSFQGCQFPGTRPFGTMVIDQAGNLYGTTEGDFNGAGLVFQLSKGTNGTWSERTIYNFSPQEGAPNGDLTWDSAGNIYGTTWRDTTIDNGQVFELSPQPDGSWKKTVLYAFPAPDGTALPVGGVIFDTQGNLYGTTFFGVGGNNSLGAVYKLSPQSKAPWEFTLVYNFPNELGGIAPTTRLTFDSKGNLYGTGTLPQNGAVFELSPGSSGTWELTSLHTFTSGSDGSTPYGTLVLDAGGSLYGTTSGGGSGCNGSLCGVVYKISPQSDGTWKETILHQFESADDGSQPYQGLLLDSSGNLFGTTFYGGSRYGYGTVFEIPHAAQQ